MPVLEFHRAVLDAYHHDNVAGLRVLDDHAEFYWQFSRSDLARVVRVAREHVRAVTIVHPLLGARGLCDRLHSPGEDRPVVGHLTVANVSLTRTRVIDPARAR